MTETSRSFFVESHLPVLKKIPPGRGVAARRAAGAGNLQDREAAEADFIAEAWQHYVDLSRQEPKPALCRVLCALHKPEPPWTHRPEPDVRVLSMGNPRVRRLAEAEPA